MEAATNEPAGQAGNGGSTRAATSTNVAQNGHLGDEEDASYVQVPLRDSPLRHTPPSAQKILTSLNRSFFETAPHDFDEKSEALANFGDALESSAVLEHLLDRVEQIDLARDAVSNALANEVRHSSEALLSGMRQVQDLDLDSARTMLHVVAIRRRLRAVKRGFFEARLNVKHLSERRENRVGLTTIIARLVELKKLRDACYSVETPLSEAIAISLQTERQIRSGFDTSLQAVGSVLEGLNQRLLQLKGKLVHSLRVLLIGPQVNEDTFNEVLACLRAFEAPQGEYAKLFVQNWNAMIESFVGTNVDETLTFTSNKGPFGRMLDSCKAFSRSLVLLRDRTVLSPEEVASTKRDALSNLAKIAEEHLKSPLVRSQVMDDFSITISDAGRLVDRLDGLFGVEEQAAGEASVQVMTRTKIESSIRQRARIYAQQYQAEGFQAMRGLLWRELWVDVAGGDTEFAKQILNRLGVDMNLPPLVITATMASGVPRQVQRTLDLMRKLPSSAAGEAFLGLLRIVDLYLLAVLTVFVPATAFFESKRESRSAAKTYLLAAREALAEWLLPSSPRTLSTPSGSASGEGQVMSAEEEQNITPRLSEVDFVGDPSVSFELALVAAQSLDFLKTLLTVMEGPLSEPLPNVERAKMASKLFVDVPAVIDRVKALVHRAAAERISQQCRMPPMDHVYVGTDVNMVDGNAQMERFRETLFQMQIVFTELQTNPRLPDRAKAELWDESCACFFDKYLDAIASMERCSPMDRGNMILHLANFNESLTSLPQSKQMLASSQGRAQRARTRVDDFIKAFYYDKPQDLWDWMRRRKDDLEHKHYLSILRTGSVGQRAGQMSYVTDGNGTRAIGEWKDLTREFDKIMASLYN
jgi:hypothetical protein